MLAEALLPRRMGGGKHITCEARFALKTHFDSRVIKLANRDMPMLKLQIWGETIQHKLPCSTYL